MRDKLAHDSEFEKRGLIGKGVVPSQPTGGVRGPYNLLDEPYNGEPPVTVKGCGNLLVSIVRSFTENLGMEAMSTSPMRKGRDGPLYITSGGVRRQSSFKVRYDCVSIGIERRESTNIVVVSAGN